MVIIIVLDIVRAAYHIFICSLVVESVFRTSQPPLAGMALPNIWHHRKVAETAARSCDICYKPSSSVLVTPDKRVSIAKHQLLCTDWVSFAKFFTLLCHGLAVRDLQDFFYVCPIHLKDRGFCSPIIDEEEIAAKKRKEEMDKEIEKVKQEYEEKMKRKKQKSKDVKDGDDKRDKKKDAGEGEDEKAEKEKDDKVSSCHAFLVLLFHRGELRA